MQKRTWWLIGILTAAILGFVGLRIGLFFYTDLLWFRHLGYGSAFLTTFLAKLLTLLAFSASFVLVAGANIWVARAFGKRTRELPLEVIVGDSVPTFPDRFKRQRAIWWGVLLVLGFFLGLTVNSSWILALRFFHPVNFGFQDPVFGRDVGFYVFKLPLYLFAQGWLLVVIVATAILVAVSYYQDRSLRNEQGKWVSTPYVRAHLSALGAAYALVLAWGYVLKEYDLLYSSRKDTFFGPGYTDLHIQLFAYRFMLVLAIVMAIALCYNLHFKGWRIPAFAGAIYLAAVLVVSWGVPILFEDFVVQPNELSMEKPYIRNSIQFTRRAYGLNHVKEVPFPATSDLTARDVQNNQATVQNIPIWDRRPLMNTYSQLQEIRSYYRFGGIDIDRYHIQGQYRQVMLAAREFSYRQLAMQGDTWVNRHLVYTHGYGICMSPANKTVAEGLPDFFVKNIPPVSPVGIRIDRPEIYFGEDTRDYVIVHTKTPEFDYPRGDANVYTSYHGRGGVALDSFFRRVAFALRFGDPYLLVTDNLTPQSRILFDRQIGRSFRDNEPRRFAKMAPFLEYDSDPYLVVANGRLVWVEDAYTVTNMFPYSEPYGRPFARKANYIRNSVKITLDAYDGTVNFYVWDPTDPLIRSYMEIYPGLFKPRSAMPAAIRRHVRYPADLFQIQAHEYNTYHMASPQVFYNREDVWEPATEVYGISESPRIVAPYYLIAKLPDAKKEEFLLMQPVTPVRKDNMIAWYFARCDSPNYGQLIVYKLPKEKLIFGPMLVERRIDQDTNISQEITLWSQRGSDVIRGNLMVVPIKNSFLSVEPLYLRATQSGMPELKRVLVVYGDRIAMADTLEGAISKIFGSEEQAPEGLPGPAPVVETLKNLAQHALDQLESAQTQLRSGNFSGYGQTIQALQKTLGRLAGQEKPNGR